MRHPAVSLFSGAGGMDIGVDGAGFKTQCSIELDPHCVSTLCHNSREKVVWQVDIRVLDAFRVASTLNTAPERLALLYGGPPCQPFSQIGKREGMSDPRSQLAFEMVRFAKALKPAAVMIEQVPKFLDTKFSPKSPLKDVLAEEFLAIGYDLHAMVLDASDYDVPQRRRRAIVACVPCGQAYEFPFKLLLSQPTRVGEVIDNLTPPTRPSQC